MSKKKSQIGHSAIARQQPPPIIPGPPWATTPPIAGAPAVMRRHTPSPPGVVSAVPAALLTKHEGRARRDQRGSAERRVTAAIATEPKTRPRRTECPSDASSSADLTPKVSREHFGRLIARLQVRINALSTLQRTRELALADPGAQRDSVQWRRLLSDFETHQAELDELIDKRDEAQAQLEAIRDETPAPAKRIKQRPSTIAVRTRLGRRIRELREQRGLSREVLARAAEIPTHILLSIETGDKSTGVDVIAALAYTFDMTVSEVLLGVDATTDEAERLASVLAAHPMESQRVLALVELATTVASGPRSQR